MCIILDTNASSSNVRCVYGALNCGPYVGSNDIHLYLAQRRSSCKFAFPGKFSVEVNTLHQ